MKLNGSKISMIISISCILYSLLQVPGLIEQDQENALALQEQNDRLDEMNHKLSYASGQLDAFGLLVQLPENRALGGLE